MTIAIAWVRSVGSCEELVFVSDSRLSGDGNIFDSCPKLLALPRHDCAIAFAGYTGHAFPMMLQLSLAIDCHGPAKRGSLDLAALRSHTLKVFDGMISALQISQGANNGCNPEPDVTFLFGGYSWIKKKFQLWSIRYDPDQKCFCAHPALWMAHSGDAEKIIYRKTKHTDDAQSLGHIAFAGDQASVARSLLLNKLNESNDTPQHHHPLDMEPFEVVRDMLRNPEHSETIGGAPQVVKVYQYMRTAPLGVFWPNKANGKVYLQGRRCLGYERIDPWIIDPDTLLSELQPSPLEPSVLDSEGDT